MEAVALVLPPLRLLSPLAASTDSAPTEEVGEEPYAQRCIELKNLSRYRLRAQKHFTNLDIADL